jgi:hypothetical protein
LTAALAAFDAHGEACGAVLATSISASVSASEANAEVTPGISAGHRLTTAAAEIAEACDGFFARAAIAASLTADERREILRGMMLTRSVDNRLKTFFSSGEVKYGAAGFQGKGFRSLGQEAIYAAGIRLRRGEAYGAGGDYTGDVVAAHSRSGCGVGHASRSRSGADGAQRADGQGRSADGWARSARRRFSLGRSAGLARCRSAR